jgi:hypothetical protein
MARKDRLNNNLLKHYFHVARLFKLQQKSLQRLLHPEFAVSKDAWKYVQL